MIVLAGFYIYFHGLISRGSYFVLGLVHLPLVFVFRWVPLWAPLLSACFIGGYLTWVAFDWGRPTLYRSSRDNNS
jgi:hypothetical protein